jgi:hypothetical protein
MPDNPHGLGAIPSPPDERDFPVEQLYALTGTPKAVVIPPTYVVPNLPAVLDQDGTPQCVAYSSGGMKLYEDGPWPLNESLFFAQIGGGPNGAYIRNAFKQLLAAGYPPDPAKHKVSAYYAVPLTQAEVQSAILTFGPIVIGIEWLNSMFRPAPNGVLLINQSQGVAGGHAILLVGWTLINGIFYWILRNSWGADWGVAGNAYLSGPAFTSLVSEAWKAVDVPEPEYIPMTATTYTPVSNTAAARVLDTRLGLPLGSHLALTFPVWGGVVPIGAVAVTGNLTITGQTSKGFLALGPVPTNNPGTSSCQAPDLLDNDNGFTVGLAADGTLSVTYAAPKLGPTAHVIVDITGYFK